MTKKIKIAISVQELLEYEDSIQSFEVFGLVKVVELKKELVEECFDRLLSLIREFISRNGMIK